MLSCPTDAGDECRYRLGLDEDDTADDDDDDQYWSGSEAGPILD